MQDFKKRHTTARHIGRFLATIAGACILLGIVVTACVAAWRMYGTFKDASEARENSEHELQALHADEARVSAAVAALKSPNGVEKEVRERYGVVKPGEGEIRIVRDETAQDGLTQPQASLWQKLFQGLFAW